MVLDGGGDDVLAALAKALGAGKMAQLSASVPPEVKKTRFGPAPSAAATCARACISRLPAAMPSACTDEGLPQSAVKSSVMVSTQAAHGFVVAELSR